MFTNENTNGQYSEKELSAMNNELTEMMKNSTDPENDVKNFSDKIINAH